MVASSPRSLGEATNCREMSQFRCEVRSEGKDSRFVDLVYEVLKENG